MLLKNDISQVPLLADFINQVCNEFACKYDLKATDTQRAQRTRITTRRGAGFVRAVATAKETVRVSSASNVTN